MSQIYGPVPSRRLGLSLGIDLVPFKTCSFDCIYCQLGRTIQKTLERKEYIPATYILEELKKTLKEKEKVDFLTLSGSGEPTLHSRIGYIIREIKKIAPFPIAVLTNGSLLFDPEVQKELLAADLVIPSLDAPDEGTFQLINRPSPSLTLKKIAEGIRQFSWKFKGKIWVEIMLIKDINDKAEKIEKMTQILRKMRVDKIHLNTPIRPPAESYAKPCDFSTFQKAKEVFGQKCQIISPFAFLNELPREKEAEKAVLEILKRRPLTSQEISSYLGVKENVIAETMQKLEKKKLVESEIHEGTLYYRAKK